MINVIILAITPKNTPCSCSAKCIKSVWIKSWLWLIDDASTDNTLALAKHLQAQVPDKIRGTNASKMAGGVAKARNWGALQSETDLIAF